MDAPQAPHQAGKAVPPCPWTFDESTTAAYIASHAVKQMAAIARRDEPDEIWRCRYCRVELAQMDLPTSPLDHRPHPERDHVVPRSLGGGGGLANRVLSCQGCNVRKADKLLSDLPAGWSSWRDAAVS